MCSVSGVVRSAGGVAPAQPVHMSPTLPGILLPNPMPRRSARQPPSPPHGRLDSGPLAAPPQEAPQQAQGAAGPAADSATAKPDAPAAQQAAEEDLLMWQQQQQQRRHQRAAQAGEGDKRTVTAGTAARRGPSGGQVPVQQHGARPGDGVAARPGCTITASVVAGGQPQLAPQAHGSKLPAVSAISGALARVAAANPQGLWQRAERPAESSEDARAGGAAPDPTEVHQDGGASATSGSATTGSALWVLHPRAAVGSSGETRSELAAAADEAAAGVLQRLQQVYGAERMAHEEVSAPAAITLAHAQLSLPYKVPAGSSLLSAYCACIQAQQAAGPVQGCSPAQSGAAAAEVGTKRKRKLEAAARCALGVGRACGVAPHEAAAGEEQERKRLRAALLCVRAAAAGCPSVDHARLPGGQPCLPFPHVAMDACLEAIAGFGKVGVVVRC